MSGKVDTAGSKSGVIGTTSGFVEMVDCWHTSSEVNRTDSYYGKTGESVMKRADSNGRGDGTNAIIGGAVKMSLNTTYGVWTFPLTGVYRCASHHRTFLSTNTAVPNAYWLTYTYTDWNGSSGTANSAAVAGGQSFHIYSPHKSSNEVIFRVENTSTHAVQFRFISAQSCFIEGSANLSYNHLIFTRLADL